MKPGDFALGSEKSRAAARRLADQRTADTVATTIWMDIGHVGEPSCSPWIEGEDGRLGRVCSIPDGMTIEEAKRIIDGRQSRTS
jgi:hypothetical protein